MADITYEEIEKVRKNVESLEDRYQKLAIMLGLVSVLDLEEVASLKQKMGLLKFRIEMKILKFNIKWGNICIKQMELAVRMKGLS